MIKILQNWEEVGRSIGKLREKNCGYHPDPIKNWDLVQISDLTKGLDKTSRILDMGCGGSATLGFLHRAGFKKVKGIDFKTLVDRKRQAYFYIKNNFKKPYSLIRGDLTSTKIKNESIDLITCVSVIEHGVHIETFLSECSRILKPQGKLFVSTDYWDKKLENDKEIYGLKWNISSRKEIIEFIKYAKLKKLILEKDEEIPEVKDKVCNWNNKNYTFISLVFKKIKTKNNIFHH